MDSVVIIRNCRHKLCLWSPTALYGIGQFGADGQSQPLNHKVEFPAEALVYPEVEDAVEETIWGWQPNHHKLNPLWYAASWDCCEAENMGTEVREASIACQQH